MSLEDQFGIFKSQFRRGSLNEARRKTVQVAPDVRNLFLQLEHLVHPLSAQSHLVKCNASLMFYGV